MQRPDRRDGFLILFGLLALLLGYAYAVTRVPHGTRSSLSHATQVLPLWAFGAVWILTGVVSVLSGLVMPSRIGFVFGAVTSSLWGTAYILSWAKGDPGRGWLLGGIFWAIAGMVFFVAGLIDPKPIARASKAAPHGAE